MGPDTSREASGGRMPRRVTDRIEDVTLWVLMSAGLIVAFAAFLVGMAVRAQVVERSQAEVMTGARVDAVLLEDTAVLAGEYGGSALPIQAQARWLDAGGVARSGPVGVHARTAAGSTVPIWVDRDGAAVNAPVSGWEALVLGVLSGAGLLMAAAVLLRGTWLLVLSATAARNHARWEQEWDQVGPGWTRQL